MSGVFGLRSMNKSAVIKFFTLASVLVFFALTDCVAQKKRESEKKKPVPEEVDNSFAPFKQERTFESGSRSQSKQKKSKKQRKNSDQYNYLQSLDQKKEEFYKRIKQNAKEDKKIARKMQKPQYSDPSYFGHKRKPKKRPVGKRKLCKECGIVH